MSRLRIDIHVLWLNLRNIFFSIKWKVQRATMNRIRYVILDIQYLPVPTNSKFFMFTSLGYNVLY